MGRHGVDAWVQVACPRLSIDWGEGRGVVDGVVPRASELVDPAVANVDHVVLLFGLTQPPVRGGAGGPGGRGGATRRGNDGGWRRDPA